MRVHVEIQSSRLILRASQGNPLQARQISLDELIDLGNKGDRRRSSSDRLFRQPLQHLLNLIDPVPVRGRIGK